MHYATHISRDLPRFPGPINGEIFHGQANMFDELLCRETKRKDVVHSSVFFNYHRISSAKQGYVPLNHLKKIPKNAEGNLMKTILDDAKEESKKEKSNELFCLKLSTRRITKDNYIKARNPSGTSVPNKKSQKDFVSR